MHDFIAWILVCVVLVCIIWILSGLRQEEQDETTTVLMAWLFEYDGHKFTNWSQLQGIIMSDDILCTWDMLSVDPESKHVVGIVYARSKDIAQEETSKAYEEWLKEVQK